MRLVNSHHDRQRIEQCRESKFFMWSLGPPHDMLSFTELIRGEHGPKFELDDQLPEFLWEKSSVPHTRIVIVNEH